MPGGRRPLVIRACGKVNLGLEVLGRRDDGYHELLTFLSAIEVADRVTIEATGAGLEVEADVPGVPVGPENLAWRAAELLRRAAGEHGGVRVRIAKRIPVAGGLGGGSANAAAVLLGLSRLWGLRWPAERLGEMATELGMDVPFFLGDGPAMASGRGERLSPVRGPAVSLDLVVVNPGFPLATRAVYEQVQVRDFTDGARVRGLVAAWSAGPGAVGGAVWNGLEAAAARLWPGLGEVKRALAEAGALGVVMSGSGPSVVAIAGSAEAAARLGAAVATRSLGVWVTRSHAGPALVVETAGPHGTDADWGVAKR